MKKINKQQRKSHLKCQKGTAHFFETLRKEMSPVPESKHESVVMSGQLCEVLCHKTFQSAESQHMHDNI